MLSYRFTKGQYGKVTLFHNDRPVAENLKLWCVRNDPESQARMLGWIGFNEWRYLGIIPDTLPRGVTVRDVADAYLVARDEIIDVGDCVPG